MMGRIKFILMALVFLGACATDPGTDNGPVSSAPPASSAGPAASSAEYFNQLVGNSVYFELDKYELNNSAEITLRGQASWLNQNPSRNIVVEGHCDERGTREYNLGLGERRANAVRDYLTSLGVAPSRIRTISYGKERPVCVGSNEDCWSKNRRSVSVVK
ncbi:MAG: peptidoglycan-associated lipoprotein Pal [Pseudomonadota bacterium]|nr:peptidoglycan-associated lipoprotein Pal [Pseudomonadota bacterium]